mmetsp:Transcript_16688/g.44125  ORF Transcript_16688/g.44125 Transcript_16688/m.44125 type:complete len:223 (-) Transcript_16688:1372-2040(-)
MPWNASNSSAPRAMSSFISSGEVTPWPAPPPPGPPAVSESPSTARSAALRCSAVACLRNMPAPRTFCSISSFSLQRASMCLSTFESVTKRTTRTSLVWPTRCTRATACLSFWGFQSMSKSTTVSAACRFRPRPPARADSRKTFTLSSELKRSMRAFLCSCATWPSSRTCTMSRHLRKSSSMSSKLVNWEKTSTLWPKRSSFGNILSRASSLPEALKRSWPRA